MVMVIKAPAEIPFDRVDKPSIFLAGSIDMGSAVDWQQQIVNKLVEYDVNILNPRRDDWDSTWEQSINNEKFYEQVSWELDHLTVADLIIFYFDVKGKAPITLLEMGLFADEKTFVCCPEGFWRKGNVDIVCERFDIPQVGTLDELSHNIEMWCIERIK